jgi:hypothetical protein
MKVLGTFGLGILAAAVACGGGGQGVTSSDGGNGDSGTGPMDSGTTPDGVSGGDTGPLPDGKTGGDAPNDSPPPTCSATCPTGYTCGFANGMQVCRSASGIPLFSHVFVILMENTSLSTLSAAMTGGTAPNLAAMAKMYATGSDYHGVAHPSLPNYIALTSGSTQGIACDCQAQSGMGTCIPVVCLVAACSCPLANSVQNIADQLEATSQTWMAFGESMGTPCNMTDGTDYAVRHVPFLYYGDIGTNATRCSSHVVDFAGFDPNSASAFTFIAPNLTDDMHNPDPTTSVNIPNGDKWIGPQVASIVASKGYTSGGLLVVVWDEDDGSGGLTGTDDPIGIFVMSPYAKSGGYVSSTMANHYSLLATFEDGLNLPRLGMAASATPLADYFPTK